MQHNIQSKLIVFAVLTITIVAGWTIGGKASSDALMLMVGGVFGSMVGIPMMLIMWAATRRVRHDHYHHINQTPVLPKQSVQLPTSPTRYVVIDDTPAQIQSAFVNLIEVKG